jgi:hypothetical protein
MSIQTIIGAAILSSFILANPALSDDERSHRIDRGMCQRVPGAGVCTCSLPMAETELSFGEAAGLIELYFYEYPDESYVQLLSSLLRQCIGVFPATGEHQPIVLRQDSQASRPAIGWIPPTSRSHP